MEIDLLSIKRGECHTPLSKKVFDNWAVVYGLIDVNTILLTAVGEIGDVSKLTIVNPSSTRIIDSNTTRAVLTADKLIVFYVKKSASEPGRDELWRYEVTTDAKRLLSVLPDSSLGTLESSRDGSILLASWGTSPVRYEVIDGLSGASLSNIIPDYDEEFARPLKLHPDGGMVYGVGFRIDPIGTYPALNAYDINSGKLTETTRIPQDIGFIIDGNIIHISPNGRFAAIVYGQKSIIIYDLEDNSFKLFNPKFWPIEIEGWLADNSHVMMFDRDRTYAVYDVFGYTSPVAFAAIIGYPKGLRLNKGATRLGFFADLPGQLNIANYKEYSTEGWNMVRVPYTYGNDVITVTANFGVGVVESRELSTLTRTQLYSSDTLEPLVSVSGNNKYLVFQNKNSKRTTIINRENGNVVNQFFTGEAGDNNSEIVQISEDGKTLGLFGYYYGACYNVETGSAIQIPDLYLTRSFSGGAYQMSVGGRFFMRNTYNENLLIYDRDSDSIISLSMSDGERIELATFTRDGNSLVGVSRYGTVNRWSVPSFNIVDVFQHKSFGKENRSMSLDFDSESNTYALGLDNNSRAEVIHRNITSVIDGEVYKPSTTLSRIQTSSDRLEIEWSDIISYSIYTLEGAIIATASNENPDRVLVSLLPCPTGTYIVLLTSKNGNQYPQLLLKN